MIKAGAEILWECMTREGVEVVFGYPGGANMPIYDAMLSYPVHHVLVRHEQGAAHMADGYARASGKVGVAMATSGPGATNLVTGIATAMMDSSPIVCITGQVHAHLIGGDAFQETDVTGITLPITKHNYLVTRADEIAEVVSRWTGIPVSRMLEGERDKLLRMEEALHKRVVGQDESVRAVSDAIRRSRAGLSDASRPIGSFLFLGPTGVGKTELTKALAAFLFDTEEAMVRIDMSEFMEKHSVARLIGAPPGYVGYEEGGYLTEAVRRKPYSVILLDEVEKAHPDVFNVLLQVLDDGRLTDGHGRTVDFRNTVIVMTSNLGSQRIQELAGEANYDRMKAACLEVVGQHFRPEFINRVDDVVVFHPLGMEQIRKIVDIQLGDLQRRLAERDIRIELSDAARDRLGEAGFDPVYGARPLKRAIQQQVENPLAEAILRGEFGPGQTIKIEAGKEGLSFLDQAA